MAVEASPSAATQPARARGFNIWRPLMSLSGPPPPQRCVDSRYHLRDAVAPRAGAGEVWCSGE